MEDEDLESKSVQVTTSRVLNSSEEEEDILDNPSLGRRRVSTTNPRIYAKTRSPWWESIRNIQDVKGETIDAKNSHLVYALTKMGA